MSSRETTSRDLGSCFRTMMRRRRLTAPFWPPVRNRCSLQRQSYMARGKLVVARCPLDSAPRATKEDAATTPKSGDTRVERRRTTSETSTTPGNAMYLIRGRSNAQKWTERCVFSGAFACVSFKASLACLTRMVGKLDGVDRVDVEAQELQRKHGALVADVPAHDMALNAGSTSTAGNENKGFGWAVLRTVVAFMRGAALSRTPMLDVRCHSGS